MKYLYSKSPKGALVIVMLSVFLVNGIASYFESAWIPDMTRIIAILVLLTLYFKVRTKMANVFLTIFLFSFLGDLFYTFNFGPLSSKLSTTFYLGSYSLIIFVLLGKLRRIKYEGLVTVYLIVVLLLNTYFLYVLYGVVKDNFSDDVNMVLSIFHGISLIAMTFFAFAVYLSQETTQSIIYLVMVFGFVFSDVLTYICNLYVYFWAFSFLANMLHLASLILLFTYVSNHHKIIKIKPKQRLEKDYLMTKSERLTA